MLTIETDGLTKVYSSAFGKKKIQALVDFNLNVYSGMIFGLLGPNGAGKTTLIKLLLSITYPTAGRAKILNTDISDYMVKKRIGYLPENHKYPSYLSGGDVLNFYGALSGMEGKTLARRIDELLALVNLTRWKKTKVKAYSKGMMQRLGLAQSLLNDPELIFLDEPTDGVDPIGRKEIRDILIELKSRGKTIFLNSHLLSEVELITDRVAILNKGRMLKEGTVSELTEKKEEYKVCLTGDNHEDKINASGRQVLKLNDNSYILKVEDAAELNAFIDYVRGEQLLIKEVSPQKSTLEDMFISLIKESEKEKAE